MPLAAVTASFVDLVERLRAADAEGEAEADVGSRRWAACSAMGGFVDCHFQSFPTDST